MASKLSYVHTPLNEELLYSTVPDRLRILAEEHPDKDAFVFYDKDLKRCTLSRAQVYRQSQKLAKLLVQMGMQKGTPVAICMDSSLNMLLTNFAVISAGGVPFYAGASRKDGADLIGVMNRQKCEMIFIDAHPDHGNWSIVDNIWPEESKTCPSIPTLTKIIYSGDGDTGNICGTRISLRRLMNMNEPDGTSLPAVYPEDELGYFCTSGSTGQPKDVTYTHFAMLNFTKQTNKVLGIKKSSVFFCDRAMGWVLGYPRTYLIEGTTRVFLDPSLTVGKEHIADVVSVIDNECCDVAVLPGYIVTDLLNHRELADKFKHVDTAVCSGERVPASFFALKGLFCKQLAIYYGTTEAGGIMHFRSNHLEDYEAGIIGKPQGGAEVKIVNEKGNTVPVGEEGELCFRSLWRFAGYKHLETSFRAVVDDLNWFHSGDIGHMRKDGNVIMSGRKQEMISSMAVKYFPWNIEKILIEMPGVKHVFAVGVPDERQYEVVCACVVPEDGVTITVDDIKRFCDRKFQDSAMGYGAPKKPTYHLLLDSLLITPRGKIDRRGIKIFATEKLGLKLDQR